MAIYHNEVTVCSGKKGGSAVASAAYQTADKIYSEQEGLTKDYSRKENVLDNGIIKPDNAPEWCLDRQRLWNEVEKKEGAEGRYARKHNLALPKELSFDEQKQLVENYCNELAREGMVCDYAIHNNKDGTNPHAHIMTTVRHFEKNGEWGAKSKNVALKDKDGNPIIEGTYKNGRKKYKHKCVKLTDWDETSALERWREKWARLSNEALERSGSNERISAKSYNQQKNGFIATQHLGPRASQLEKMGIKTEIGDWNRFAEKFNTELNQMIDQQSELGKAIEKAEVIYYEQSRAKLKPIARTTVRASQRGQNRKPSLLSDSKYFSMQDLPERGLAQDTKLQNEYAQAYNQSNMPGNAGRNLESRNQHSDQQENGRAVSRARSRRRLQSLPAHRRGVKERLGSVSIHTLEGLTSEERQAVGRKFTPLLKKALGHNPAWYNQAGQDIKNTVFARSASGEVRQLNLRKDQAIQKGFLGKKGESKTISGKQAVKGLASAGGQLLQAGKASLQKTLSASADKTRSQHFKNAKANVKDAVFKTPMNVIKDIFTNPITAIFKLPLRAVDAIGSVAAAGVEIASGAGKREGEVKYGERPTEHAPLTRSQL